MSYFISNIQHTGLMTLSNTTVIYPHKKCGMMWAINHRMWTSSDYICSPSTLILSSHLPFVLLNSFFLLSPSRSCTYFCSPLAWHTSPQFYPLRFVHTEYLVRFKSEEEHYYTILHNLLFCSLKYKHDVYITFISTNLQIWCDSDRASSLIRGNKMPTRCNRGFYCRSYCLLNMFRAPLCSSSGAQEYYTVVAACGISCCGFQVAQLHTRPATWKPQNEIPQAAITV